MDKQDIIYWLESFIPPIGSLNDRNINLAFATIQLIKNNPDRFPKLSTDIIIGNLFFNLREQEKLDSKATGKIFISYCKKFKLTKTYVYESINKYCNFISE